MPNKNVSQIDTTLKNCEDVYSTVQYMFSDSQFNVECVIPKLEVQFSSGQINRHVMVYALVRLWTGIPQNVHPVPSA